MRLLDLVFPKFCVSCGNIGSYICSSCQKTIYAIHFSETICPVCERSSIDGKTHPRCRSTYSLDGLVTFFQYRGAMQNAIKRVKYQFVSDITYTIVRLAVQSHDMVKTHPFLARATIVPIPLHGARYRHRGFNQTAVFAKELAHFYHLSYAHDMIRRKKPSSPQVEMKKKLDRLENMKDAFEIVHGYRVPDSILLVDDVFTTGATMREAGRVLKHHGAKCVWGVTIAR